MNQTFTAPVFASILDESPTGVTYPTPLPVGTYLCVVGPREDGESSQKKTPFWRYSLRPIAALEDVDDTALQEVGGLENKLLSTTFYLTPDAISMFDEFFANCNGDFEDGQSRKARSLELQNSQVLAVVSHRMNEEKTRTFAEVRRTAKAD